MEKVLDIKAFWIKHTATPQLFLTLKNHIEGVHENLLTDIAERALVVLRWYSLGSAMLSSNFEHPPAA